MIKRFEINNVFINRCLLFLCIVSIYILLSSVFDCLRFPFSILSYDETKKMDTLLVNLASSYLTGYLVYYLTIIIKNKIERRKRKWELYDFFKTLEEANHFLEEEKGTRMDKNFTNDWYDWFINRYNARIHEKYLHIINQALEKEYLYREILTESENDQLQIIKNNINFTFPDKFMKEEEIQLHFSCLKIISECIIKLNNRIRKKIQKRK